MSNPFLSKVVDGENVRIADSGGYYTEEDSEGVFQEIGASLDNLGLRDTILGVKFEGLPASTAGTRMAGASGLTFRVNAGSMDLSSYPDTDIRNYLPYSGIRTAKINDAGTVQAYMCSPHLRG